MALRKADAAVAERRVAVCLGGERMRRGVGVTCDR